jgi:hypothetical protein
VPVVLAAGAALLGGAGAGYAQTVRHTSQGSSRPPITLRSGTSFRPTLGDWEGTVNGLPASFQLSYGQTRSAGYGIDDLVALRPAGCPATAGHYVEDVIASTVATPLRAHGSLGLSRLKFGGSLSGGRTATLTRRYRVGGCTRTLRWTMHPATRRAVTDGVWKVSYNGGGSGRFHVLAGGRLATALAVPTAMTRCNGLAGKFDLFIGPSGTARLSQTGLRATIQFTRRGGNGRINSDGAGCAGGPFRFRVSLTRAGT